MQSLFRANLQVGSSKLFETHHARSRDAENWTSQMNFKMFSHQLLAKIDTLTHKQLIGILALIAGLITVRIQYVHMGWINSDSVLYLEAAKWMVAGDFTKALAIYNWPFYSICIATVSKIFHTPIFLSAQILSTVFFMLATTALLNIVSLLGGNNRTIVIGAITLFGCDYIVGDILPMLMRDQGYWAFFLLSVWAFIKFTDHPTWLMGGLWQVSVITAALFRIEGIFYLALPLVLLFEHEKSWRCRLTQWLKANYLNLLGLALLLIGILLLNAQQIGRLQELSPSNIVQVYSENLLRKSVMMSQQILGGFLEEYGLFVILVSLFLITFIKSILSAGAIASAIAFKYFWDFKNNISSRFRVIYAVMLITFLSMYMIITKVFILSGRYTITMAFMLLILASFGIAKLFQNHSARYSKKIAVIVLLIFSITLLKNLMPKPEGFNFRQDAMVWLKKYNTKKEKVFFNETRLAFYYQDDSLYEKITVGRKNSNLFRNPDIDLLNSYKFFAIYVTKEDDRVYKLLKYSTRFSEINSFRNNIGDKRIYIFRINNIK